MSTAALIHVTAQRTAQAVPGTDTFGNVFKMLSIAGLISLGVMHPDAIRYALTRMLVVIQGVIGTVK